MLCLVPFEVVKLIFIRGVVIATEDNFLLFFLPFTVSAGATKGKADEDAIEDDNDESVVEEDGDDEVLERFFDFGDSFLLEAVLQYLLLLFLLMMSALLLLEFVLFINEDARIGEEGINDEEDDDDFDRLDNDEADDRDTPVSSSFLFPSSRSSEQLIWETLVSLRLCLLVRI